VAAPEADIRRYLRAHKLKKRLPVIGVVLAVLVALVWFTIPRGAETAEEGVETAGGGAGTTGGKTETREGVGTAIIHGPYYPEESYPGMLAVPIGEYWGVENIYIVRSVRYGPGPLQPYNPHEDLAGQPHAWYGVITQDKDTVEVPAGSAFDIVVAIRIEAPEKITYVNEQNMHVYLRTTGAFEINENSLDDQEFVFENEGYGTTSGRMRVNVVWNNNLRGFTLQADQELYIENADIYSGWWGTGQ
jgi:hypothetical protein